MTELVAIKHMALLNNINDVILHKNVKQLDHTRYLLQVLAIEVCMKYVPSLLLPAKDKLLEHMNIFLRSLD